MAVAQSIELGKAEVLKTKEECRTKQGELAVKNNKLADLEAEVKQLTVRNGILQEQKDTLVQTREELVQHLVSTVTCILSSNTQDYVLNLRITLN